MDVRESMKKQNDVAMVLSRNVFSGETKHSNMVFSPASIYSALTLAASGPGEPSVADEILSILKSSSTDELNAVFTEIASIVYAGRDATGGPTISSVNGVWIEQSLSIDPKFKDLFENFLKAGFDRVDFRSKAEQVRKEVNEWALKHTNGHIKDLLPPRSVTPQTNCIYGNALYFKGAWETPLDKPLTRDGEFHLLNGNSVSVPFMSSYYCDQYVSVYDGFKVLVLPYERGDTRISYNRNRQFSMYIYLPDKKDGLDSLVEEMATTPGFLDSHIPTRKEKLEEFRIPKFKISFGFMVSRDLSRLGLHSMPADMYHKACIRIDEDGAEAAAATAYCLFGACAFNMEPPKRIKFVADHPFLFLIREDFSGTVLFAGQIFDPSESS